MNAKLYSSAIKKTAYRYAESKRIAFLLFEGKSWKEIYDDCVANNGISIASEARRREVTNVVYNRVSKLDKYMLEQFVTGDITTSKFILVLAIANTDKLFFEFLFEKYREALITDRNYLSIDDFDSFYQAKKETNATVAKWCAETLVCLAKGYRNILAESGMGIRRGRSIEVQRLIIHPDVERHIAEHYGNAYIEAMLGGETV